MNDPFDIFSDGFSIGVGPETANLSFSVTAAGYDEDAPPRVLGTVRMGIRQLRAITFTSWELIQRMEREGLIQPQSEPPHELDGPEVSVENWRRLWSQDRVGESESND